MTDADLDRLEALADAASPSPWEWEKTWSEDFRYYNLQHRHRMFPDQPPDPLENPEVHPHVLLKTIKGWGPTDADAAFIASARTAVPALVAEVRRLRNYLKGVDAAWDEDR